MPARVQRTRTAGRPGIPPGAIYVGRGPGRAGRYGNPYRIVRDHRMHVVLDLDGSPLTRAASLPEARAAATSYYRRWIRQPEQADFLASARQELAGRDLACWCPLPGPGEPDHCHAAVLLELVNTPTHPEGGTPA